MDNQDLNTYLLKNSKNKENLKNFFNFKENFKTKIIHNKNHIKILNNILQVH